MRAGADSAPGCRALIEYIPPVEPPRRERGSGSSAEARLARERLYYALRCYQKAAGTHAGRIIGVV